MAFEHNLSKIVRSGVIVSLILMSSICVATQVTYQSPMGEEEWRMSGNPIRCGLSLKIPNYGIGYFEQYATEPPHFILRTWDEVAHSVTARVVVKPPVWKPGGNAFLIAKPYIKSDKYGVFLSREPTLKLLTFLFKGNQADFNYRSPEGFNVTVTLSPIRFQKVYAKYQQCLGNLLSFNYTRVKESVFHFGVDSRELTDEQKDQLHRIAQYAAADNQIEKIRIVGYADETGRKGYNNAISEYRAKAVKRYLLKLGVPLSQLSVTWVGVLKPVARNDTDVGRAANRRVVINLIKK